MPPAGTDRLDERRADGTVGERRRLADREPADLVVLLGGEVRRLPPPGPDHPGAEVDGVRSASRSHTTQGRDRAGDDPHAELLVQLPRERLELRLASLHMTTGQVPHPGMGETAGAAMHEQDPALADQRADDDLMDLVHGQDGSRSHRQTGRFAQGAAGIGGPG